jgi:hypothetical protein
MEALFYSLIWTLSISTAGAGLLANAVGQNRKCRLTKPVR